MKTKIIAFFLFILSVIVNSQEISLSLVKEFNVDPNTDCGTSEHVEFSWDSKLLAAGNGIGEEKIIDIAQLSIIRTLVHLPNFTGSKGGEVECGYFSIDDSKVATAGNGGSDVKIWNVSSGTLYKTLSNGASADGMAFSPDGKYFVVPAKGTVKVYRISDWSVVGTIVHNNCDVNSIDFTKDSQYMVTGSCDKTVKITRTSDWQVIRTINTPASNKSVRLSPDGKYIATANGDNSSANIWNFSTGSLVKKLTQSSSIQTGWSCDDPNNLGTPAYCEAVAWTIDGKYLFVTGALDGKLKAYRTSDWTKVMDIQGANGNHSIEYIDVSGNGNYVATSGEDGRVRLWSINYGSSPLSVIITNPTNGQTFNETQVIAFNAIASGGNGSLKVEFFVDNSKVGEDLTSPYEYSITSLSLGNHVLMAKAVDASTTVSSSVTITINPAPNNFILIPAKIEAENYIAMLGVKTETTTDVGGGSAVGYIDVNDWIEYNIDVPTTKTYTLDLRVASFKSNGKIEVKSGATLLATFDVPNTGGWNTYTTLSKNIALSAGKQTIRLTNITSNSWNINWLEFKSQTAVVQPTVSIISPIEKDSFTTTDPIVISANAQDSDGSISKVEFFDGTIKLGEDNTSPYSITVSGLSIGIHQITAKATDNGANTAVSAIVNIKIYLITGGSDPFYTKIEAENYSAMYGIKIETTTDLGGGKDVGYIETGDWMDYIIDIPSDGVYSFTARVASAKTSGKFEVKKSNTVLATLSVPNTGGWQKWTSISSTITLTKGIQTLRIQATGSSWNINWIEISTNTFKSLTGYPYLEQSVIKNILFPNPVRDYLTITNCKDATISIVNRIGEIVLIKENCNEKEIFNLIDYSKGIYIVTCKINNDFRIYKIIRE